MMQNNVQTLKVKFVSLAKYDSIKNYATSSEKDQLVKSLLTIAGEHDLYENNTPISEISEQVVENWVSIQEAKSSYQMVSDQMNTLILNCFPKAFGKIKFPEIVLIGQLIQACGQVRIGVLKQTSESILEIWIICKDRKYEILEKAAETINHYIIEKHTDVNCVVIKESQLIDAKTPNFIMSIGKSQEN